MIINGIYETQYLLSLYHVSFLVGLRIYQHSCTTTKVHSIAECLKICGKWSWFIPMTSPVAWKEIRYKIPQQIV